jgi:hypothetical protein
MAAMLNVIFTLDYEIHGNGEGCPHELMVEPTRRLMDLFDEHGAKLTIMADVAEILKFKEYKEQRGRDDYHYEAIADQLCEAIRRGHDVQLHLHTSYFNARHENGRWQQDWSEYNFAGLPLERLNEVVRIGKQYLEDLLKPVDPKYECMAFRAANWSVSPSRNVVRALLNNSIRIDTSVFKYGRREGLVSFDYSSAHNELEPWPVDENDICRRDAAGKLIEVPIYCERRWIGAFLTAKRIHRVLMSRANRLGDQPQYVVTVNPRVRPRRGFLGRFPMLAWRHAWKADFNQCTGRQLVRAANRAAQRHGHMGRELPFVLIGHSKLFTRMNEGSVEPFLRHIEEHTADFQFGLFADFGPVPAINPKNLGQTEHIAASKGSSSYG